MNTWIFCMLCQVQEDPSGIQSCIQNIKKMVYRICLFLHDKKKKQCSWFSMMVSLALLKLHCVSKITPSHLCLHSIPHLDTKHYIPPDCQPLLMPQIASASYRMAALCYNAPLGPFSFSASHSMYSQFILQRGFGSACNTFNLMEQIVFSDALSIVLEILLHPLECKFCRKST